jgi:diadenosine tetraphosphate (Ap4A) HIT family hydrolase
MQPIKRFKDLPWTDPGYTDTWYASYDAPDPRCPGHRIYVPKDTSHGSVSCAFTAAYKVGETRVNLGDWTGFVIKMEFGESAGQEVGWPHLHLTPT